MPTTLFFEAVFPNGDASKHIDMYIFNQVLDMDEDEAREFSMGIVEGFFAECRSALSGIALHIKQESVDELLARTKILIASAKTIGLIRVLEYCEKMRGLVQAKAEADGKVVLVPVAAGEIDWPAVERYRGMLEAEYKDLKMYMETYYGEQLAPNDDVNR